ncbi:MAG: ribonuclease E activity regulator RraA [Rhodospirillales bacterium]|nr:MAG: ribonuclease E activity regulator RraA [Rhodospirillales bacterium]
MARPNDTIIRTADICDDHGEARVCELQFRDFAAREHFHGEVVTFATFEDNKGLLDVLKAGGAGKVLVIDGRGSMRRALCGGNIAVAAFENGWEGLVFNGAIRDSHEFAELDFGVKALGTTAMPPRRGAGGRAGEALIFGGIAIDAGDYLYADRDAVIVLAGPVHG